MSAGLFFFLGCATTPKFYLNGLTKAQFDIRDAECANMAASNINQQNAHQGGYFIGQSAAAGGGAVLGLLGLGMLLVEDGVYDIRYEECMRSGGFTKVHPSSDVGRAALGSGDYFSAFLSFKEAADANDHVAQFSLGVMYEEGWGVTKDHAEAVRWYRKAANQGNVAAKNILKKRGL
jgi:TPR repeat protein